MSVYYCYAVVRPIPDDVTSLQGVAGEPVELIAVEDMAAVVSPVPTDQFSEGALKAALENVEWLEEIARAHNVVVDELARRTVTLPFRLATIYLDACRVREALRSHHDSFSSSLDRLQGRVEWGVKIFVTNTGSKGQRQQEGAESGRSYLRSRIEQRNTAEEHLRRAEELAETVDARLTERSEARHQLRAQNNELAQTTEQNVFNVAYLVPASDNDGFAAEVSELDETASGVRVELTGPWVPYSFAIISEDDQ